MPQEELEMVVQKVTDSNLKHTLSYG
eukprot:SAG25_NODE_3939_length_924_cov_0.934545_1_plen_25_part_10